MKALALAAWGMLPALAAASDESGGRHLIYLHGRIIQDQQDARPRHPEWGYYELEKILATFRERGFSVSGEIRPRDASLEQSADRLAGQVRRLVESGVPRSRIAVVGGSMGAAIALRASLQLQDPALRFAVLGVCLSHTVPLLLAEYGSAPAGRILVIRERSDETSEPCPAWSDPRGSHPKLVVREIVLATGQSHGFLYRPLPEWVGPVLEWTTPD